MKKAEKVKKLQALQDEIDKVRRQLNISGCGEVLYRESLYADTDEEIVVVADGFGKATTSIVEGNYPIDFFTRYEKVFKSEAAAISAADKLSEERASPVDILG